MNSNRVRLWGRWFSYALFIISTAAALPAFSQENRPPLGEIRCDTLEVDRYLKTSQQFKEASHDSAYVYIRKALEISYRCDFSSRIIRSLTEISAWYFGSDVNRAFSYAQIALREYTRRNLNSQTVPLIYKTYNILAKYYETKGMMDSSAYYYYLLNNEIEKGIVTDPDYAVSLYSQLALFWINSNWDLDKGNIEATNFFIEKAREAEKRLSDSSENIFTSYMLKGAHYTITEQFDSARWYYQQFLERREQYNRPANVTWYAAIYLNIAETYIQQHNPEKSLEYLEMVFNLKERLAGYPRFLMLAKLYLVKTLHLQKRYKLAIAAYQEASQLLPSNSFVSSTLMEVHAVVSDSYKALGQLEKALEHKDIYIKLRDSLSKKEKIDIMNRLQVKFSLADKDRKIAEQKLVLEESRHNVRKKNWLIGAITTASVLLACLFILWRHNSRQKQILQQEEINNFRQKLEIENLNAMIKGEEKERKRIARELHDGVGGLLAAAKMNFEALKRSNGQFRNEKDLRDGIELIREASSELHKVAHTMMPEILLQEGLVEAAGYYCEMVSRNSNTRILFQVSGEVRKFHPDFELSVYRIIQELVHNIIKHARATQAIVQLGFSENIFDITVEDNGIGIPPDMLERSKGIGLKSIEDRIRSINGRMEIRSEGEGTSIYLEVDLHNQKIAVS